MTQDDAAETPDRPDATPIDGAEPGLVATGRSPDAAAPRPPAARRPDDEAEVADTAVEPVPPDPDPDLADADVVADADVDAADAEPPDDADEVPATHPVSDVPHAHRHAETDDEPGRAGSGEHPDTDRSTSAPAGATPAAQRMPGDPAPEPLPARTVARGRFFAWGRGIGRSQLLAGLLCALLGFALVVQARQTQTQGLDSLRQADLVRLLDNVTNAEARAQQDVRDEQAIRDRLLSGSDSSAAAQEAAQRRLDTLGILAGTVPASGPGIVLEITDPRRQVDASVLLDTLEELRDGGAEVIQIGSVRVVAATAFTDEADGVRVDNTVLTPPYTYKVIGDPQTLSRLLQIPGGVLDVVHGKGAQGKVSQPPTVTVDALRPASRPQYARPAPGPTP
jgi:uncharacterized protein YlxW (UPF0749 family)